MSERTYLSIGEVLALLKEEFQDITISKIRFLESQGLIDPERTPSGYRKFYEADVERLRWILRQQKEHFLPLRVIRGKLADGEPDEEITAEEAEASHPALSPVPDPEPEPEEAEEPREAVVTSLVAGKRQAPPVPRQLAAFSIAARDGETDARRTRAGARDRPAGASPDAANAGQSQSRTSPAAFLTAPDDGTARTELRGRASARPVRAADETRCRATRRR